MAEWSNAAVLKTVDLHGSGGSNPSLSATRSSENHCSFFCGRKRGIRSVGGVSGDLSALLKMCSVAYATFTLLIEIHSLKQVWLCISINRANLWFSAHFSFGHLSTAATVRILGAKLCLGNICFFWGGLWVATVGDFFLKNRRQSVAVWQSGLQYAR